MAMFARVGSVVTLASLVLAADVPAAAAPIGKLNYLVGRWKCTYRAGATSLVYDATYAYDREIGALRQVDSFTGGSAEELLSYDAQRKGWTAVVIDGQGTVTVMHGAGANPNHFAYRSVYPDTSIADVFDRVSATEYTLHATVRSGGKTIASVDTCSRQ